MIVVDASALVELLLRTDLGLRVEDRLFAADESLHAPHLLYIEVAQALRNLTMRGEVPARRAGQALRDLELLRVVRHLHVDLLPRVWRLRTTLTAYDAAYVVLAEALGAPLVTCDGPLASSPGHRDRIEWIG